MEKKVNLRTQGLSRRTFVGAAGVAAASLGIGLTGCASDDTSGSNESNSSQSDIEWTDEADVIIMGFGGAGATAALEAARQGANVIIFEKAPEEFSGGNTSVTMGYVYVPTDEAKIYEYARSKISESSVSDAELRSWVSDVPKGITWLEEATGYSFEIREGIQWAVEMGLRVAVVPTLLATLQTTIKSEYSDVVNIHYETPVTDLIVNPENGEILGVKIINAVGEEHAYKAKKGVVLACGSFENNPYMIEQFCYEPLPEPGVFFVGSPYNTGDGIELVSKVGGKLRYLNNAEIRAACVVGPSLEFGMGCAVNNFPTELEHVIAVNKTGKRFMAENWAAHDATTMPQFNYDSVTGGYPNYPYWYVFDDVRRAAGPLASWTNASDGWAGRHGSYTWSEDNQAEIERGWILQADTIAELAEKMSVDAATLEGTVSTYNASVAAGEDIEFGRADLSPVETGPYYAAQMGQGIIFCHGGPVRNEKYQVINYSDEPIPRLYSAGEFGALWGRNYPGGMSLGEALLGFRAGAEVAALEPWE